MTDRKWTIFDLRIVSSGDFEEHESKVVFWELNSGMSVKNSLLSMVKCTWITTRTAVYHIRQHSSRVDGMLVKLVAKWWYFHNVVVTTSVVSLECELDPISALLHEVSDASICDRGEGDLLWRIRNCYQLSVWEEEAFLSVY